MAHTSTNDRVLGRTFILTSALAASMLVPAIAAAQVAPAPPTGTRIVAPVPDDEETIYVIGAIADPKAAKPADNPQDEKLPALPVVYDDAPAEQPTR